MSIDSKPDELATVRDLPAVDELVRMVSSSSGEDAASPFQATHRAQLSQWSRAAIDACRSRLLAGESMTKEQLQDFVVRSVMFNCQHESGESIRHVINATGVLLHTNLGRAPLAKSAAERVMKAVAYCNVELNLTTGRRSKRGASVAQSIADLVGAEAAVIVNNCAAATILVLHAIAAGRDVIISRGQLVEIGGGFRLPDVFSAAGVNLREVGTTNRTYLADYENAISENTGAIIRVHRGNFKQSGFVTQPSLKELIDCERSESIPVIDDVGSGCVFDFSDSFAEEPNVKKSVSAGSDLVLFSGDKLFGGPQSGIVVGKSEWIERLRKSPMMRAMRIDKLTLAALQATVEIHSSGNAAEKLPLIRMMRRDSHEIREQCETLVQTLGQGSLREGLSLSVESCESQIGGGAMPDVTLSSHAICVTGTDLDDVAARLRSGVPAVQARLAENQLLLDLRTVLPDEVESLTRVLAEAIGGGQRDGAAS